MDARLKSAATAAGPLALIGMAANNWLREAVSHWQEEGIFLLYPQLLSAGLRPYRDFEYLYGPGHLHLLKAVFAITGPMVEAERAVGIGYRLMIIAAVVIIANRRSTGLGVAAGLTSTAFLLPTSAVPYPWLGAAGATLLGVAVLTSSSRTLGVQLLGGLLLGAAVMLRFDFLLAVVPVAITLLLLAGRRTLVPAVTAGTCTIVGYLVSAPPADVLSAMYDSVVRIAPARRLPLNTLEPSGLGLFTITVLAALLVVVAGWRHRRSHVDLAVLAAAVIGMLPQLSNRISVLYTLYVAAVVVPLALVAMAHLLSEQAIPLPRATVRVGAAIAAAGVVAVATPDVLRPAAAALRPKPAASSLSRDGRSLPLTDSDIRDVQAVTKAVASVTTNGRLFIGPSDLRRPIYNETHLYFLFPKLTPATRYLEMNPGSANRPDSNLAAEISSSDVVVITHRFDDWREPNRSSDLGPAEPNSVVEAMCLVQRIGVYDVRRRC